ncbi:hypothetical protein JHK82_033365 [Glycine max]|nr:hypothetical protein JHK82_033365 [Glycine max]KAG5139939.1 hypothetical protein JHK84_033707 [Glycine max]
MPSSFQCLLSSSLGSREDAFIKMRVEELRMELLNCGLNSWMSPIWNYMVNGQFPDYEDGARKIKLKSTHYVLVDGEIFRLGISIPLLKCLDDD